MYGTIARMKIKRENLEGLRRFSRDAQSRRVPGYRSSYVLVPDEWNDEVLLVVMFDDRDSYHTNADDPAQHEDYLKMRALLEADPEWTDGEWEEA